MGDDPCRILIVEDEQDHAELIRRAFALRGAAKGLAVAGTLTEARAYLARSRPHLVIADLLLPDGKGTDLLSGEWSEAAYPLMVMTAHGDEQAAVDVMKAGAIDYVVKSDVTFADMPRIARRALRQWQDITDRKRAEEELQVHQRQLRSLASELVLTEERQRQWVAARLHDDVIQDLAVAKIKLGEARDLADEAATVEPIGEALRLLDKAVQNMRSLILDLSPPALHELSLGAALHGLAEQFEERHGVPCEFGDDGQPKPLAENLRVTLFRAAGELLVNVAKHARAGRAAVRARRDGDTVQITVDDDGVGFDHAAVQSHPDLKGGFGLFSIRERLGYLGGRLELESAPGRGTRATLIAPLEGNDITTPEVGHEPENPAG